MVLLQLCWSRNEAQRTMNIFVMTAKSVLIIFISFSHSHYYHFCYHAVIIIIIIITIVTSNEKIF